MCCGVVDATCAACWSLFTKTCVSDGMCTAYTNCIMERAFPLVLNFIETATTVGSTLDLSPFLRQCSSPVKSFASNTTALAWRNLLNISKCYATTQCSVAPRSVMTSRRQGDPRDIIWSVPGRVQTLLVDRAIMTPIDASSVLEIETVVNGSTVTVRSSLASLQQSLEQLLQWPSLELRHQGFNNMTLTWPAFTGFLPTYSIKDVATGLLWQVVDDPFPAALLQIVNRSLD
jgi:hypothetical protein